MAGRRTHGGCDFAEQPDRPADEALLFWLASWEPAQVEVSARPVAADHPDATDFKTLPVRAAILIDEAGCEHWSARWGGARLSLRVGQGTLLAGPVLLDYHLPGLARFEVQLATLGTLVRLTAGLPSPPPDSRAGLRMERWHAAICAYDLIRSGASHRDIAVALYGQALVESDWRREGDYLRTRIQRLVRDAHHMVAGGYRNLLG